jgi:hypothetical protein
VVKDIALFEWADMHILEKYFPVPDACVAVLQVYFRFADGFDFRSCQHHPGFYRIQDDVIMTGFSVLR